MARGHRCPSGSSGLPQNGHGGRPAATTFIARCTNDRAYDGRIVTSSTSSASTSTSTSISTAAILVVFELDEHLVVDRKQLDDDQTGVGVPAEGDRADAELLDDRLVERVAVAGVDGCHGRDHGVSSAAAERLVEQHLDSLGEHGDLLLLEGDARDPRAISRLEEKRPLAGLADRAGHETLGLVEAVHNDRHTQKPTGAVDAALHTSSGPASDDRVAAGGLATRRARLGGIRLSSGPCSL